jgi:hypothetical protein
MKKFFLTLLSFCTIVTTSLATPGKDPIVKEIKTGNIRSIVINANVTVMLLNFDDASVRVSGDKDFMKLVSISEHNGKLIINSTKNTNLVEKGTVFIPASSVGEILVNSAAQVKSVGPLEIPNLDIRINGECKIHLLHVGRVNLYGNDVYDYTRESRELLVPNNMLRTRKQ